MYCHIIYTRTHLSPKSLGITRHSIYRDYIWGAMTQKRCIIGISTIDKKSRNLSPRLNVNVRNVDELFHPMRQ
jgi:hypothetical protein